MGQAGLAQSRRPVKQHMVYRFAPSFCGRNGDIEVFLGAVLPDEIRQRTRPEAVIEGRVFYIGLTGNNAGDGFVLPGSRINIRSFTLPQEDGFFTYPGYCSYWYSV